MLHEANGKAWASPRNANYVAWAVLREANGKAWASPRKASGVA